MDDHAGNQYNRIRDFDTADDSINIANILDTHYDPLTDMLSDFVSVIDNGAHSYIRIDEDGNGAAAVMNTVTMLIGYAGHGHTAQDMVNNGYLVI